MFNRPGKPKDTSDSDSGSELPVFNDSILVWDLKKPFTSRFKDQPEVPYRPAAASRELSQEAGKKKYQQQICPVKSTKLSDKKRLGALKCGCNKCTSFLEMGGALGLPGNRPRAGSSRGRGTSRPETGKRRASKGPRSEILPLASEKAKGKAQSYLVLDKEKLTLQRERCRKGKNTSESLDSSSGKSDDYLEERAPVSGLQSVGLNQENNRLKGPTYSRWSDSSFSDESIGLPSPKSGIYDGMGRGKEADETKLSVTKSKTKRERSESPASRLCSPSKSRYRASVPTKARSSIDKGLCNSKEKIAADLPSGRQPLAPLSPLNTDKIYKLPRSSPLKDIHLKSPTKNKAKRRVHFESEKENVDLNAPEDNFPLEFSPRKEAKQGPPPITSIEDYPLPWSDSRKQVSSNRLSDYAYAILRASFNLDAYPSTEERIQLANELGITKHRVSQYFQGRRNTVRRRERRREEIFRCWSEDDTSLDEEENDGQVQATRDEHALETMGEIWSDVLQEIGLAFVKATWFKNEMVD